MMLSVSTKPSVFFRKQLGVSIDQEDVKLPLLVHCTLHSECHSSLYERLSVNESKQACKHQRSCILLLFKLPQKKKIAKKKTPPDLMEVSFDMDQLAITQKHLSECLAMLWQLLTVQHHNNIASIILNHNEM